MEKKNIYTKLMEVRVAFHKLELKKSGLNKFAGFKYYELGDFLVPATKLLQEANLCPMISFNNELAVLTLINGDEPTEQITFTSPMRDLELKGTNAVQNLGGVQTYLTRYLYIQLLNIVEADVFDATSGKGNELLDKVYDIASKKGFDKPTVNKHIKAKGYMLNNFNNEAFEVMYKGYSAMESKN